MSLYKDCKTAVSDDGKLSSSFSVKVGVHQGSSLSPLLFIIVMDILTEDVIDGSLMELLYADDLVLCGESLNEVMDKCGRWKNALERKYEARLRGVERHMIRMMCGVRLVDRVLTDVLRDIGLVLL